MNVRLEKLTHNHELNSRAKMFSRNATALNALDKREIYLLSKSNVKAAEIARYINETTGKYTSNKQVFNNLALSSCSKLILLGEIDQLFSLVSSNEDKIAGYYSTTKSSASSVFFAGRKRVDRFQDQPSKICSQSEVATCRHHV